MRKTFLYEARVSRKTAENAAGLLEICRTLYNVALDQRRSVYRQFKQTITCIDRYDSFTLKQAGWKLEGRYLTISRIGRFKLSLSRPVLGDIKTITVRRAIADSRFPKTVS